MIVLERMHSQVQGARQSSGLRFLAVVAAASFFLFGCAGKRNQPNSPETSEERRGPPETLQASASVISAEEAVGIEELLVRGNAQLDNEEYDEASRTFERAVAHAAIRRNRLRALYGWGTAVDLSSRPKRALEIYSRYFTEAPPGAARDEIAVRQVRLLVYLERYAEAAAASRQVGLKDRSPVQQLALLGARAHAELLDGRLEAAELTISKGRAIVDQHMLDRVTIPSLDVASLYFALGELRSKKAGAIKFDPVPPDFPQKLEARCQLILDAQSAYSETMRSEDAHWSSMSGVKVGQLYKSLHSDLMAIPAPETAVNDEKKALFEGAMRLRYSILLTKSLSMMEATVALLDRTHQKSRWRARAREALKDIQTAQKDEETAIDALPYSRAQLQQVLDDMAAKAKAAAVPPSGS